MFSDNWIAFSPAVTERRGVIKQLEIWRKRNRRERPEPL